MRVIVICRLMSGWVDSIRTGVWRPSGGTAIAKMVEDLDRRGALAGLLLLSHYPDIGACTIKIKGISVSITIAGNNYSSFQGIWAHRFTALRHCLASLRFALSYQADMIYADRGSIIAARLLSGWPWRKTTIIRLLGIPGHLWEGLKGNSPSLRLRHWAFRGKFSAVLCSRDGTSGQNWMDHSLAPSTPRFYWLNGVDTFCKDIQQDRSSFPRILCLGRVQREIKRTDLFVRAALALYKQNPHLCAQFVVVGEGPLRYQLEQQVIAANAQNIIQFTGGLPHDQAQYMMAMSDIFVSFNKDGQLVNANLEALSHGLCLIFSKVKGAEPINDIIPDEAVIWIDQDNPSFNLQRVLLTLINDPQELAARRLAARAAACSLPSWQERIEREWNLLCSIIAEC